MNELREWLAALPPAARIALSVLVAVQVALQIAALVHLARRADPPRGGRWVWVLVIVAGNLLGAVLYFALGRGHRLVEGPAAGDRDAARRAADVLYGPEDRR